MLYAWRFGIDAQGLPALIDPTNRYRPVALDSAVSGINVDDETNEETIRYMYIEGYSNDFESLGSWQRL